jgi:hypothetical protein
MAKNISDIVKYRPKPSLSLDAKDLPEIKNFKIGQKYTLTVEVKVISLSSGDEYDYDGEDSSKITRGRFRVTKVEECED